MPRFDACPSDSQSCVSTLNDSGYPGFDPVPFDGTVEEAVAAVKAVVTEFPRTEVVQEDGHYVRTEFTTKIMRFTDTVQFEVDAEAKVVHFRSDSVSWAGKDMGANRKRMNEVTERLQGRLG